jgi:hypothetical protein
MSKGGLTQLDQRSKAGIEQRAAEIRKMVTVMMRNNLLFEMMLIDIYFVIFINHKTIKFLYLGLFCGVGSKTLSNDNK